MMNVEKYLEETEYGIMVKRSEILADIRRGELGYYDICMLCEDERVSSQFFTSGLKCMKDKPKKVNEKYIDQLFWLHVAEEFNLLYLLYFKSVVDKVEENKKQQRENLGKEILAFAGGAASVIGGVLLRQKIKGSK